MALFGPQQFDPNYGQGGGLLGPQLGDGGFNDPSFLERLKKTLESDNQNGFYGEIPLGSPPPFAGSPVPMAGMMTPQGTYQFSPQAPAMSPAQDIAQLKVADVGPDPVGNTAIPPAAKVAQFQQAQQQPPQQPPQMAPPSSGNFLGDIGNSLGAGFQGMANAKNPMQALGNLVGGLATGQRMDPAGQAQQNQAKMAQALYGALTQRGIPHQQAMGIASAAATDPKLAEALLPQALGLKPPNTVEGVIADRLYSNRGGTGPGAQGGQNQVGSDPYAELKKLKQAEAEGSAGGKAIGETEGAAVMNLPSAIAQSKEALRLAGELRTHKGRDNGLFWHSKPSAYLPDSAIPGNTDARDAVGVLNQIKGGAFLEAFKALKGGGQITEVEGKKATDAIARMDRSQSRAEFDKALTDYEGIIRLGVDRASQQAGQAPPFQFKGNSEWQQIKPGVRIRQVQ